jgi:membrane-associated phospholipid phosphatase
VEASIRSDASLAWRDHAATAFKAPIHFVCDVECFHVDGSPLRGLSALRVHSCRSWLSLTRRPIRPVMSNGVVDQRSDVDVIPNRRLDLAPRSASTRGHIRDSRAATRAACLTELGVGGLFLGIATLAGLVFVHHPWPNRLDIWGDRILPADLSSHWAHGFVTLGSMTVLIAGAILVFFIGVLRDWVRAIACMTAPVIAVVIVQEIAKPLVDRQNALTGALSYPSGTVAAVAALATALTLVVPAKTRFPVAVLGLFATVGTAAAVIVLRWHYPTDALGGVAVGVGSVLVIDALLQLPRLITGTTGSARRGRFRVNADRHVIASPNRHHKAALRAPRAGARG